MKSIIFLIILARASQITSLTIVYPTVYSGADQRKLQSSASLAFVRGIHRRPVNSLHKGPITWKMSPFDDVIMLNHVDNTTWLCNHIVIKWKGAIAYSRPNFKLYFYYDCLCSWTEHKPFLRYHWLINVNFNQPFHCWREYSGRVNTMAIHDDVIKWKHFPRNWPFVRGIHRSRWIPHTKASDADLWCFLWSASE